MNIAALIDFAEQKRIEAIDNCDHDLANEWQQIGFGLMGLDIDGATPIAHCCDCGKRMTLVCPGKHQCDSKECNP